MLLNAVCANPPADEPSTTGLAKITRVANPDDYYPSGARRRGEEGAPIVKVCVGPDGALLSEPAITEISGNFELDAAAIRVAKANRYAAVEQDGAAIQRSCIRFKVKFGRSQGT